MSRSFKKTPISKDNEKSSAHNKALAAPFVEEINRHYIKEKPIRNVMILGKFMTIYLSILKNKP